MPEGPVLDRSAIDDLLVQVDGDTSFIAELVETFLEDAPELLRKAAQAASAQDAGGLRMAAHTLKSTAASLGATRLSAAAAEIERLALSDDLGAAERLLPSLEAECGEASRALALMRDEQAGHDAG